ncbi:MAG TPA: PAS domain S-box protein [Chitinophagaceae bacterium]
MLSLHESVTASGTNATPQPAPAHAYVQELLDFSPDVICIADKEGRFIKVSAAAQAVWGYAPAELEGKHFIDLVTEDDRRLTQQAAADVVNGAVLNNFRNHYRCRDGRIKPILWSARWNSEQEIVYCIARDGSEREAAEQKAEEYEQRLYRAYKLANIGWWEWHNETKQLHVSDELMVIFGLSPAQRHSFSLETFLSLVHPDDRASVQENWSAFREVAYAQYEHRLVKPSGEVIYVIHYVQQVRDETGKIISAHGTTKDITSRKKPELALKASQQKLKDIVESLGDGFIVLDRDWKITYWNKKAEEMAGVKRAEVIGVNFWDLYPKARTLKFYSEFQRAMTENIPVHFEEYSPSLQAWMEVSAYPSPEGLSLYMKDITVRKQQEEERHQLDQKLQKAQQNLQNVFENMSDGFFTVNREWTILFANDKIASVLGLNKESYIGKNLWACFPQAVPTRFYSEYRRAFSDNTFVSFEEFLPGFDLWFEVNAYPANNELSVYLKDITDRKRQEQALQISTDRFHFVSMATSDIVWDWNIVTGELYINQSFTRVFGYELTGTASYNQLWRDNLYPDDRERILASQAAAIQNPTVSLWEDSYRFMKKCGEVAYVTDRAVIIRNNDGSAVRMVGAVQDITERRRQEKRLEFMAQATSEVIWERTLHGDEVEVNGDKLKQLTGYDIGGNFTTRAFWRDKTHPDDLPRLRGNRDYALLHDFEFYVQEYRFRKADGTWIYVKDRIHIIKNDEGKVVRLMGALGDITTERLTEKAIVESEISYRQLFNNAPLPSMIFEAETFRFLDVNSSTLEHYGFTREEFLQMTVKDIRPAEELVESFKAVRQLNPYNKISLGVITHFIKGGNKILVEAMITRIVYKGKNAYLATIHDVTEKLRLQHELTREKVNHQKDITKAIIETQEKERSEIGKELHDNVNQMLTTAKLYVENISYYPGQAEHFAGRSVGILQNSINEIRRLSRALVTPTIRDVGFKDTLSELVASYLELHIFEAHASFEFDDAAVPKGIKLTIYRILQEAFNNTVKYARASIVQVYIRCTANTLRLVYIDDGVGFDPGTVKRGIGLQNIQNRTNAYRGKVQIRSAPGSGCELKILFPLAGPEQPEPFN